jgi:hypothetical protein
MLLQPFQQHRPKQIDLLPFRLHDLSPDGRKPQISAFAVSSEFTGNSLVGSEMRQSPGLISVVLNFLSFAPCDYNLSFLPGGTSRGGALRHWVKRRQGQLAGLGGSGAMEIAKREKRLGTG